MISYLQTRRFIQLGFLMIFLIASHLSFSTNAGVEGTGDIPGEQVAHTYYPSDKISGYLVYLPKDYNDNPQKQYPVVVFFHGAGEVGTNIERLKYTGLPQMIAQGTDYPFIMIAPQARYNFDNNHAAVDNFLTDVKGNYRIDNNRLYVTGLSMGGAATWAYATHYASKVAAAVPICGWGYPPIVCNMKNVPVWAFHNQGDNVVGVSGTINTINALKKCYGSPVPKQTIYPVGGHDAWTTTYKSDAMWNWMLSQSLNNSTPAPSPPPTTPNKLPVVNAGSDKSITLPTNSVYFYGSAYDQDGSVASYQWTKSSGPSATITDANKVNMKLSNLTAGTYTFKLTVTDNVGGKSYDEVNLTVLGNSGTPTPAPTPPPTTGKNPIVNAGSDKTLTLPENLVYLYGSAYDPDGSISSFQWTKVSGPSATITDAYKANVKLSNLVAGSYIFRLTVTDNSGLKTSDETNVHVLGSDDKPVTSGDAISINFNASSNEGNPWNNTASNPYANKKLSNLKDNRGTTTSISLTFLSSWGGAGYNSSATNSIHSENVAKTYYWTNYGKETLKISGLDKSSKYTFEFYGYRSGSGDRTTDYIIGSNKVSLNASNNTSNSVKISDVSPDANGEVTITVKKGTTSSFGYLNAMVIRATDSSATPQSAGNEQIVYRINSGGNIYPDGLKSWSTDNRNNPIQYLDNCYSEIYDHTKWGDRTNSTDAPDYIFESHRYELNNSGSPLGYKLPVANGKYQVKMYFSEYAFSPIKSKGQRVFNIYLENSAALNNFDIFGEGGNGAIQKTFTVDVKDGVLNIQLKRVVGLPILNGIEIVKISGTATASLESALSKADENAEIEKSNLNYESKVYPNPVVDVINIELFSGMEDEAFLKIFDVTGRQLSSNSHRLMEGRNLISIDVNNINIEQGLFFLKIILPNGEVQSHKLLKK